MFITDPEKTFLFVLICAEQRLASMAFVGIVPDDITRQDLLSCSQKRNDSA